MLDSAVPSGFYNFLSYPQLKLRAIIKSRSATLSGSREARPSDIAARTECAPCLKSRHYQQTGDIDARDICDILFGLL
jgi:hypothetical protein